MIRHIDDTIDGRLYVAIDVCNALHYKERGRLAAIKRHCPNASIRKIIHPKAGKQSMKVIPVEDVIKLIQASQTATSEEKAQFAEELGIDGYFAYLSRKEIEFFAILEPILNGFNLTLIKQYVVDSYKIDGYIPEINLVIEYDEGNHSNYDKIAEQKREAYIINQLQCQIIRVNDRISIGEALSKIINNVLTNVNRFDIIIK